MSNQYRSMLDRFEDKYIPEPNSGCWLWMGSASYSYDPKDLRPQITLNNKRLYAYRYAYEVFVGPIPKGKIVCHSCGNSLCVNPEHLYAGTHKTNAADCLRHGRHVSQIEPKLAQERGRNLANIRRPSSKAVQS